MFKLNPLLAKPFITGIIELTNGIYQLASIHDKFISNQIILCAILLGFGGFSVFLQVLSITSKSDLSIKTYVLGKFFQGIIAGFYTYIAIKLIPIFNFDLQTSSTFFNYFKGNNFNNFFINCITIFSFGILLFYSAKKIINKYIKIKI